MMQRILTILLLLLPGVNAALAQGEGIAPLGFRAEKQQDNIKYYNNSTRQAAKGTAITLPFIEDFTQSLYYPDTLIWEDRQAYINNHMCVDAISRGVATLDAIGEDGLPYERQSKGVLRYADSLTSRPIDLSNYSAGDSLYFSFFYQPEGHGFDPQTQDSLMLYFRRSNTSSPWTRVWRVEGTTLQPFKQVMIPITDANFFNAGFQFRFVNKASINNTDDTWNIDYIRMDINRNQFDTAIQEVAFVSDPTFLLNDYTYMPYHQFLANQASELATLHETSIRNNSNSPVNVTYGYDAKEVYSNTPLNSTGSSVSIPPYTTSTLSFPTYNTTVPAPQPNAGVVYENRFYLDAGSAGGLLANDTIVRQQHFSNYLAYDDGTPEKSYYLKMFVTLPAKLAIEHRLNVPDTLKGIAIYFGRQVPLAFQKYFSLTVFRDIAYNGGSDQLIYQEELLVPNYLPQEQFWYYRFRKPIPLPAGKFYVGTIQPALGSSDSLYFGLDIDRTTNNHVFFSVEDEWKASAISGAVMIRPLFGSFFGTAVEQVGEAKVEEWEVMPNPATDVMKFYFSDNKLTATYTITDMQGRVVMEGVLPDDNTISVSELPKGMYIVQLRGDGLIATPKKIIKL